MPSRMMLLAGLSLALAAPAFAQTAPGTSTAPGTTVAPATPPAMTGQTDQPLRAMDINPTPMPAGSIAGAAPNMSPGPSNPVTNPTPNVGNAPMQGQAIGPGSTPMLGAPNTTTTPQPAR